MAKVTRTMQIEVPTLPTPLPSPKDPMKQVALVLAILASAPGSPIPAHALDVRLGNALEKDVVLPVSRARLQEDLAALARFRPTYPFWSHVFSIPDGSVAYGSAQDGRLLAVFPTRGDWSRDARWEEPALAPIVAAASLPDRLGDRRDRVAELLETGAGPPIHNPTRGDFLRPGARLYSGFLAEWGAIYERFGVPAEVGLAQAIVESGLAGKIKSEAGAIGFCQWLPRNWERLQRLTPEVIEAQNQTTQAAYCAAYLTVLATKYGSFLPALSEHHAGGANVGRTIINGGRLGGEGVRERYFLGGDLAIDLRTRAPRTFREVVGTYGPRSYRYAEMVFGNAETVRNLRASREQEKIFAMRTTRAVPLEEVARASGLGVDEVRRYNPALVRRVPKGATVYLPTHFPALGSDVAFWHRPAPPAFTAVLGEFLALGAPLERWEDPDFDADLRDFRRRFRETGTEEGRVMDAVLGYAMQELPLYRRVLGEYRSSPRVDRLFEEALQLTSAEG
jgi:hypothetical protein